MTDFFWHSEIDLLRKLLIDISTKDMPRSNLKSSQMHRLMKK